MTTHRVRDGELVVQEGNFTVVTDQFGTTWVWDNGAWVRTKIGMATLRAGSMAHKFEARTLTGNHCICGAPRSAHKVF